jgi:transcriptional regulator GlxA family with amidase domain/YHS domain-containing protein
MKSIYNLFIVSILTLTYSFAQTESKPLNVAIFLYEGVELLDFAGPYEVFGNTGGFNVYTISYLPEVSVFPQKKIKLKPDYQLVDCPKPDIIILPGATPEGVMKVYMNEEVMKWVKEINEQTQITMSVCTGAYFLSKNGILDGKSATTHHGAIDYLQQYTPKAKILRNTRFVEDGKIITTAGVSAGLDGALHIVAKLKGFEVAKKTASLMEYDHWKPNMGIVIGTTNQQPTNKKSNTLVKKSSGKVAKNAEIIRDFLAEETDPVCKMHINKDTKHLSAYKGKKVGLCSIVCKEMFDKEPEKYIYTTR